MDPLMVNVFVVACVLGSLSSVAILVVGGGRNDTRRLTRLITLLAVAVMAAFAVPILGSVDPVEELSERVRRSITTATLRPHVEAIIAHERFSGSAGENAAIDHIVDSLRAWGVQIDVLTFDAYLSDPQSSSVEIVGEEPVAPKHHDRVLGAGEGPGSAADRSRNCRRPTRFRDHQR